MRAILSAVTVLLGLAAWPWHSAAADATTEAQLRAALQAATAQIATLEDQVANLQAAAAPQAALNKSLQAELQALKQPSGQTASKATAVQDAAAQKRLAALNRRLAASDTALAASRAAYGEASAAANGSAAQNRALAAELTALRAQNDHCDAANAQLYKIGLQILDAYAHKDDVFGAVADREPFIGFKRVQLQNVVQSQGDKLYNNKLNPNVVGP